MIRRRKIKKGFLYEFADAILSAFLIALIIKSTFIEVAKIPSSSMEDTLNIDDQLFVDKFMYGISIPFTKIRFSIMDKRRPKLDEMVVFIPPSYSVSDKPLFVKRCIGIPGDRIKIVDNILYRNGEPVDESYLKLDRHKREFFKNWPFSENRIYAVNYSEFDPKKHEKDNVPVNWPPDDLEYAIPDQYYLLFGDHRTDSYDSRFWGPVHYKKIIGIVRFRFFPFDRIGFLK